MPTKTNRKSSIPQTNLGGAYANLYVWEDQKKENGGKASNNYLNDLGNISYEEFKDIQKRSPNVSFGEMNQAGAYSLLRQRPVTLEEARAQALHISLRSSNTNKNEHEQKIKDALKMYNPDSTQEEIEKDCNEIQAIISKQNKFINTKREIARCLERRKGINEKDSKIIEEDYSVYYSQGKLLYIWNFWRGDFDRIKNEDFDSNDKLIVKSEWLSDKASAEKVVEEKSKWSTYRDRVYVSRQADSPEETPKDKKEYGGTAQFDSGATTLVGHDLMKHINNSKELTDKKDRLYEQAHIYGWSEDTLYKMFKNAFSSQVVKDYNSKHENKITLDDHQKADLAHALSDSFTLWKIDNDIELESGGITGGDDEFIKKAIQLPKYQDITFEEAKLLYNKFKDKEKLKKTSEGEYYIEAAMTEGTDALVKTPVAKTYEGLEKKGYGYIIQDDFTATDKLFEYIHAVRMYKNHLEDATNYDGKLPVEAQKQIDAYIKEGIFITKEDNPVVGTLPISRFNGFDADIHPNQTSVSRSGVEKWKKRIQAGERPYILIDYVDYLNENRVKDGHHRLKAYEDLGISSIPVIDVNGKILDKEKMLKGGIPKRYKNLGFNRVGQKKKSTRPQKKWMVLAKKGDQYKIVHGGQKGMEDFSQHHDKTRQKRFWNRMGGFDSAKASDPFSPLYWHKRFGTWEAGGVLDKGTIKVAWVDSDTPDIMESKMFGSVEDALKYSKDKKFLIFELEDTHDDYYKWTLLPYGMYDKYKMALDWADSLNLMDHGGIADADKQVEAERLAKKFLATLSEEQITDLQQEVHRIVDSVIVEEEKKLFDLEASQEAMQSEDKQLFEKQKALEYGDEKDKVSARRREIYSELRNVKSKIRTQQNIVKAIRNGGDLTSFTDKKGLEYSRIPSFSKIKSDFIAFEEETILAQDVPAYIPVIDEETFKQKGYVFDAIRIAPDQYILAVNGFGTKIEYGNVLDMDAGYVITTLDQLALINDYYFTKAKAHGLKEAEESTKRNEEYYDKLPRERREKHLNQPNFYHSLPVAVKKEISKEDYEALSLEDKESLYKPFKKYGAKRLVSKLQDDQMWKSFHRMYETFVDPEATEIKTSELQKWVDKGLITAEAAELTKKKSSPNAVWGHPTVFAYWKSFREMMKWKIKDIQVQRETDSEIRKIALETSFGESNTNDALKEKYGILVKRQDGSKILPEQIDQIRKAWENVNKVFGAVVNNAQEANLKISHTGIKYVYASKAAGMFVPDMKTIAVTNKFGDEQFQSIMAHETAHWIDYAIGHLKSKRYASDDFESSAGLVAMAMRSNMNAPSDSDYVNATTECFARAMEQYFAFEIFGDEATLLYSYGELKEVRTYHAEDKYVSKENFNTKIKPLVQNFLAENKSWFEFGINK